MTDSGAPDLEHHRAIAFAERFCGEPDGFDIEIEEADGTGRRVWVSGRCPACGGDVRAEYPTGSPVYKGRFQRTRLPETGEIQRVTVICECGRLHDSKPPNLPDHGCGAYWHVAL